MKNPLPMIFESLDSFVFALKEDFLRWLITKLSNIWYQLTEHTLAYTFAILSILFLITIIRFLYGSRRYWEKLNELEKKWGKEDKDGQEKET